MSTAPSDASAPTTPPGPVLGLKPWFPWPLSRWKWLTAPVGAERLAALRIGIALVMLLDVSITYLPRSHDYLSRDSLGSRELFAHELNAENRWALLHNRLVDKVDDPSDMRLLMVVWVASSFLLLIGLCSRASALTAWAISGSVALFNSSVDNAGDTIRTLILFYLILSPCGGAWAVDAWIRRRFRWSFGDAGREAVGLHRREVPLRGPFHVYPWPLCLLVVQMMLIYTCNGLYKASGDTWHDGTSLYYVLGDLTLARFSLVMLPLPFGLSRWMTWTVLWWEILFAPVMLVPWQTLAGLMDRLASGVWRCLQLLPRWKSPTEARGTHTKRRALPLRAAVMVLSGVLWACVILLLAVASLLRWTRPIFLSFGVLFHLGILFGMELGGFAPYALCLYLPFVPWERWRWRSAPATDTMPPAPVVQQRPSEPGDLEVISATASHGA